MKLLMENIFPFGFSSVVVVAVVYPTWREFQTQTCSYDNTKGPLQKWMNPVAYEGHENVWLPTEAIRQERFERLLRRNKF